MQDITPVNPQPYAIEGVLITQQQLKTTRRSKGIIDEAQRRAKKIICDAEKQANALKEQGYQQGIEQGLLYCLPPIATFIAETCRVNQQQYQAMRDDVRQKITQLACDAELIHALVQRWQALYPKIKQHKVTIRLPTGWRHIEHTLSALLRGQGVRVEIEREERDVLQIKVGDYVLRLMVEPFAQQLCEEMNSLNRRSQSLHAQLNQRIRNDIAQLFIADEKK